MYPEIMVIPMREELTRVGVQELRSAQEVDRAIVNQPGTTMVIVNSICGCAAGRMRPAVRVALQNSARPEKMFSVFAGTGYRGNGACSQLLYGLSAIIAVDCIVAGRQVDLHDAAQRH